MKLLHFADLHLGVESYGRIDPDTGLSSRFSDFLKTLDQLVDYAIENKVDLVVFCGDAYKTRDPTPTQQREFARRINRLSQSNILVFLLVGNHDLPNALGRATTTEIFGVLSVKNVCVSGKPEVVSIPTPSGVIQVASLPWLRRNTLLSKEDAKNLTVEQLNQKAQEILTGIVQSLAGKLDLSLPAVLAAHVWVQGATTGTEKGMTIGQEHVLLPGNVARPEFDYVALGHIHKHQSLKENPPVVYAGSLERLDFSDEKDEKGFYVIDIKKKGQVSYEFHPVAARRFLTIEVKLESGDPDPTATVLRDIAGVGSVRDAIVKLNLILPEGLESQLRDNDLREALKEAHYFTMARDVQRTARLRLGGVGGVEALQPLEALRKLLEFKNTPPEKMKVLMEYAEKVVKGEEGIE